MRLRVIKAPRIEVQILATSEVVFLVDLHPFANQRLFLVRQQERAFRPIGIVFRPRELRSDDRTRTNLRSEILTAVRQLHVVAVISELWSHRRICLTFHTNLTRTHRVGSHRLVDFRNQEIVHRTTARTNLNNGIRLHRTGLLIDLAKITRHLFRSVISALQTRSLVIIRQTAVQVLAIDLQTVEIPSAQEHIQQIRRVCINRRIHWRQVPAVPPRDILVCPLFGLEQHLWVFFHEFRIRIRCQRSPP